MSAPLWLYLPRVMSCPRSLILTTGDVRGLRSYAEDPLNSFTRANFR